MATGNSAEHRQEITCPTPTCSKRLRLTTKGFIPRHSIEPGLLCSSAGELYVSQTERDFWNAKTATENR